MLQSAIQTPADPSLTELLRCSQTNQSWFGVFGSWCDPEADRLMKAADRELDPARRLRLMEQLYDLEARDAIALPLFAIPATTAWRTDRIAGPIGAYNSSPYGTFFNMNEWYLAR